MIEPVSKGHRTAFVAIVGRPSAGKSTFLNQACGHKVSIISSVPQTTRNRIRGIVNRPGGQLVFIDTPGFHESDRRFNQHMRGLIEESIRDAELILYMVDASRPIGEEEATLAGIVSRHMENTPTVVAINKMDIADKSAVEITAGWVTRKLPECRLFTISASTGKEVESVLAALIAMAPEGEAVYPDDYYTDQPAEFRISEIIREKAINTTSQEVPHALYVEVADMEIRGSDGQAKDPDADQAGDPRADQADNPRADQADNPRADQADNPREDTLWIRAFVLVERESQKGIVVGKGGLKIKEIRTGAQKEIARLFPYRIHLDLRVKVDPKWRKKEVLLQRLVR